MSSLSEKIWSVVLVAMENRSFDHMLGHLTYEHLIPGVNGLEQDFSKYENIYKGTPYRPFLMPDRTLVSDLPHEWNEVATQLAYSSVTQQFDMTGFVEAYAALTNTEPVQQADPMGFLRPLPCQSRAFWHATSVSATNGTRRFPRARSQTGR